MHRKGAKYVTIGGGRGVDKYGGTVEVGAGKYYIAIHLSTIEYKELEFIGCVSACFLVSMFSTGSLMIIIAILVPGVARTTAQGLKLSVDHKLVAMSFG